MTWIESGTSRTLMTIACMLIGFGCSHGTPPAPPPPAVVITEVRHKDVPIYEALGGGWQMPGEQVAAR